MIAKLDNTLHEQDFIHYAQNHGFGDIHFKVDKATGMVAIIAIHSLKLGPALGGCRFIEYDKPIDALYDVMRLARGMSYKAASVGLPLGGGKSVIIKPKTAFNRVDYFKAFGAFIDSLNGDYITAMDSGSELEDMDVIAEQTQYISTCSKLKGDPSPSTVTGILNGIQAASEFKFKHKALSGLHIAVQGLGHLGFDLCRRLHAMGVQLTVADLDEQRCQTIQKECHAKIAHIDEIHATECDIFAPCALGGIINDQTIPEIKAKIISGGANNQLGHTYHGQILHDAGILYAPDYVINAGGLIFAAHNYLQSKQSLDSKLEQIYNSLLEIFQRAQDDNIPTSEIADAIAKERLA